MRGRVLEGLALLPLVALAHATTWVPLAIDEMLDRAELVFLGTVATVRVEERAGEPWTVVGFRVEEGFLGVEEDAELELAFYGGSPPSGPSVTVSGMPRFETGERLLVLAYEADYYSPIVGFSQGLWRERGGALVDETGRRLGLAADGALDPDGEGAAPEDVATALRARYGEAP